MNEKVERFQHTIKQIFIKHCPLRTVRIKEGIPFLENPQTIKLRRLKDKLHQKRNPAWKLIDKTLKQTYRNLRKTHATNNINSITRGSKTWWRNVKQITDPNSTSTTAQQRRFINNTWMTDSDFVEKQHQYYKSLSKPSPTTSSQPACTQSASANIYISEAEV